MNKVTFAKFKKKYIAILERHWNEQQEEWGTTGDEIAGLWWLPDQFRDLLDDVFSELEDAFSEGSSDETLES